MALTHPDMFAHQRAPRTAPEHLGDLLLIEPSVVLGHMLDLLLRPRGVHVYPVASLDAAIGAGDVFSFAAVLLSAAGTLEEVDQAVKKLRATPGLRGATLIASAPIKETATSIGEGGRNVLLPRPLDAAAVSEHVIAALAPRRAVPRLREL